MGAACQRDIHPAKSVEASDYPTPSRFATPGGWRTHDEKRVPDRGLADFPGLSTSGKFVFAVSEAYRIRDGQVAEQLRDVSLIGTGPEVLSTIDMVGHDLGYGVGTCGEDGQGVPVADAQPTLRIPRIVVGGVAEGDGT